VMYFKFLVAAEELGLYGSTPKFGLPLNDVEWRTYINRRSGIFRR
jgi:hypothetical protein